jgi:hypothetical protein
LRSAIACCNRDRAAHRVDDAGELGQQAVAGALDDTTVTLGYHRADEFLEMRLQALVRALLVCPHQARIARHIGGETAGSGHCRPRAGFSRRD